jgi:hypothetical protein
MRTALIVALIVVIMLLAGGTVKVGGAPVFAHIDSVLGINILMGLHYAVFSFTEKDGESKSGYVEYQRSEIDDHNKRIMDATH